MDELAERKTVLTQCSFVTGTAMKNAADTNFRTIAPIMCLDQVIEIDRRIGRKVFSPSRCRRNGKGREYQTAQ